MCNVPKEDHMNANTSHTSSLSFCFKANAPGVPGGGGGGSGGEGSGFGMLPGSGPLPPHLLVKQEMGTIKLNLRF